MVNSIAGQTQVAAKPAIAATQPALAEHQDTFEQSAEWGRPGWGGWHGGWGPRPFPLPLPVPYPYPYPYPGYPYPY